MPHRSRATLTLSVGLLPLLGVLLLRAALAAEGTPARVAVYFSPHGGAADAVVRAVHAAQQQILVQAYSFTSAPIAKALLDAHKRGVKILAVLDKANETNTYSAATLPRQLSTCGRG
jgi:phosphatidylserine/phosphatidylglycerophosphate/cardiolipin synthase-like enzyme